MWTTSTYTSIQNGQCTWTLSNNFISGSHSFSVSNVKFCFLHVSNAITQSAQLKLIDFINNFHFSFSVIILRFAVAAAAMVLTLPFIGLQNATNFGIQTV